MARCRHLVVPRFGPGATAALARVVAEAQGDDPLAPVDVVTPNAVSGMTLRRAIADPALANVRFGSLPQLAERLALRRLALQGLRPLTESTRGLAMRRALQSTRGALADAAQHPATAQLIGNLIAELEDVEAHVAGGLERLADASTRGRQLAGIYRAYRTAKGDRLSAAEIYDQAAAAVTAAEAPMTTVILFAPERLSPPEQRLVAALADRDRLRCVLPRTGESETDAAADELTRWLETLLGDPAVDDHGPEQQVTLGLEPDADEEVRQAVRRALAYVMEHPVRPERIGITYRSPSPYARLLNEQLSVAGLPFHGTSGRRLADSVTGRTVLRLLALRSHDYPRSDVIAWLADAPVRTAEGRPVPLARWDRLSRDAGVSQSHRLWRDRLDRQAGDVTRRRDHIQDASPVASEHELDEQKARYDRRIQECANLTAFLDAVVAHCDAVASATSWADVAAALRAVVHRFLGGPTTADRWAAETAADRWRRVERGAYDAVLDAIDELSMLDEVDTDPPSYDSVRQTLARLLDRALPSGTTLGRGITVGPIRDFVGADLDLLIVLGMTEEAFPPRIRENPILRDADRATIPGLLTAEDHRRAERLHYLAATASARHVVLSAPRADTRAQRGLHPSPWFMEALAELNGNTPAPSAELGQLDRPWFSRHDSFEHALRTQPVLASASEFDLTLALAGEGEVLARVDGRYARSRAAVRARRDGVFGEWTGHVDHLPEPVRGRVDDRLSASKLQTYATCPLQYWLSEVLHVQDLDDPADDDTIDPLTKGSLVHRVLERFLGEALPAEESAAHSGRPPTAPWRAEEITRAHQIFDDEAAALEAAGKTGRPLLWQAQKAALRRQLSRILALDSRLRAERGSTPIAVEAPFGRDGVDPLVLRVRRSGEVRFTGAIDRVDRTADGGLVVLDYKTGKGKGYSRIPQVGKKEPAEIDLVERGRRLQAVMYGLAARQLFGDPDTPVESYYWFVEQDDMRRGASIDSAAERRLVDVLDVSVDGIRSGVFPAHPGDFDFFGWENCGRCAYDRVCPTSRGEQWERVRLAAEVRPYTDVADPLPPVETEESPEDTEGGDR